MQDGRLRVEIVKGEIVRVSVGAGLDEIYKRMFDSACREAEKPSDPILCAINVVVFGCFWLEATCNLRLEEMLVSNVKPSRVGSRFWTTLERRSIIEKLEVLSAFSEQGSEPNILRNLSRTFAIRNRLAHFKDDETAILGPIDRDEFLHRIADLPDHELILDLRSRCRAHADAILAGKNWIDRVFEQYVQVERSREG